MEVWPAMVSTDVTIIWPGISTSEQEIRSVGRKNGLTDPPNPKPIFPGSLTRGQYNGLSAIDARVPTRRCNGHQTENAMDSQRKMHETSHVAADHLLINSFTIHWRFYKLTYLQLST